MTIYGVSQSSGEERRLKVERGATGIVLTFLDHAGGKERGRVLVQADDLLAAVTDPPAGGSRVEGVCPSRGAAVPLEVEVRRNEVLLTARGPGEAVDAAVGLDDFSDALEAAIPRG